MNYYRAFWHIAEFPSAMRGSRCWRRSGKWPTVLSVADKFLA
jgi:hypothetical protein